MTASVRKRLIALFSVNAILLAVLGYVYLNNTLVGDNGADNGARILRTSAKLAAAKTAKIAFTADLRGSTEVLLVGTTSIQFATDPAKSTWSADNTPPKYGPQSLTATVLHQGDSTLMRSAGLVVDAKTPWVELGKTPIAWVNPVLDPTLGFTDFTLWEKKLQNMPAREYEFQDHVLPDMPGAKYKYAISCDPTDDYLFPIGTGLDQMTNESSGQNFNLWYSDDGLLLGLEVSGYLDWSGATDDGVQHFSNESFSLRFTLSDFGVPVTVTMPPATQITATDRPITMK